MALSRRAFLRGAGALGATSALSACSGGISDLRGNMMTVDANRILNSGSEWGNAPAQEPVYQDDTYVDPHYLGVRSVTYTGNAPQGTMMINRQLRKLYFVEGDGTATEYPIAVGREGSGSYDSQYYISRVAVNPTWTPTSEMRQRNPNLPAQVAGGTPENPLGTRAIYFNSMDGSDSLLRAHGTNDPSSIGQSASSGCFRMFNRHVEDLYDRVIVGRPVFAYENQSFTPGINSNPRVYQPQAQVTQEQQLPGIFRRIF